MGGVVAAGVTDIIFRIFRSRIRHEQLHMPTCDGMPHRGTAEHVTKNGFSDEVMAEAAKQLIV